MGIMYNVCVNTLQDKAKRKQLKVKLSMAKFLQDTVEEMAVSADNQESQDETKAFYDFIEKVCVLFVCHHCVSLCKAEGILLHLTRDNDNHF